MRRRRSIVSATPFSTAGMNWRGIAPPTTASANSKPAPRSRGSSRSHATPNWPWPPRLLLVLALGFGHLRDRLAVRDAHVFGVDRDAELPRQLLERDRHVGLAHAPEQRLVGLRVALEPERGVFVLEAVQRVRELVLVALGVRLDRDREHAAAAARASSSSIVAPFAARTSPVDGVAQLRDRGDVAGRRSR